MKYNLEKFVDILEKIEKSIGRIGWGNAVNTEGQGAIESQTMEIRERLDRQNDALERIASALEHLSGSGPEPFTEPEIVGSPFD